MYVINIVFIINLNTPKNITLYILSNLPMLVNNDVKLVNMFI